MCQYASSLLSLITYLYYCKQIGMPIGDSIIRIGLKTSYNHGYSRL